MFRCFKCYRVRISVLGLEPYSFCSFFSTVSDIIVDFMTFLNLRYHFVASDCTLLQCDSRTWRCQHM